MWAVLQLALLRVNLPLDVLLGSGTTLPAAKILGGSATANGKHPKLPYSSISPLGLLPLLPQAAKLQELVVVCFYCHLKTYCGPSSETIQSPE